MDHAAAANIVQAVDEEAVVAGWAPLQGGISSAMTRIDLEGGRAVVVREPWEGHGDPGAQLGTEYELLEHITAEGIPAPAPLLVDHGALAGRPILVLDFVPGDPVYAADDPAAYARAMADQLAAIHATPPVAGLPRRRERLLARFGVPEDELDASIREDEIVPLLRHRWPFPAPNPDALLHGDFWMGNVVWDGDEIAAVIDWEEACVGDPLADLAGARLDFLWGFGPAVMDVFTERYLDVTDLDTGDLAFWDLAAATRPTGNLSAWAAGWPGVDVASMRADLGRFVDAALSRLD